VNIRARVDTGFTKTEVKLTYSNSLYFDKIDVQFEYPLIDSQVVDHFSAVIGDREVIAVIKNKKTATREYEEAKR